MKGKRFFKSVALWISLSVIVSACGAPAVPVTGATPQVIQQTVEVQVTTVVEQEVVVTATAWWNADKDIRSIVAEINAEDDALSQYFGKYSNEKANALKSQAFDRSAIAGRGLNYERLDQLTVEVLLGVR